MLKKDLILRNPLRLLGKSTETLLSPGGFGVVTARAGVGKTALIVQLALNALLREVNVLHISLDDPVNKVTLWYKEMFRHLAADSDAKSAHQVWESILPHRFIMTFKVEGFSVPKLEERLTDLTEQNIFTPAILLVDGMPFEGTDPRMLGEMKKLAGKLGVQAWFTATTHRHEAPASDGFPVQLSGMADLFDVVIELKPDGKAIHVNALKGGAENNGETPLVLNPTTMLLVEES